MAIDLNNVKRFWDRRARLPRNDPAVTNLEENNELRQLKLTIEDKKVTDYINDIPSNAKILDLGGGNGFWAFKLRDKGDVYVVDNSKNMIINGIKAAKEKNVENINYVHCAAQDYVSDIKFDLIFISGLLIYLNDNELFKLLSNMSSYSKKGSRIVLRDSTGTIGRYEINNKFSEISNDYYSAVYRTREEYVNLFENVGYELEKDEDMFEDGSPLNKYKETRLRIYKFVRRQNE